MKFVKMYLIKRLSLYHDYNIKKAKNKIKYLLSIGLTS